MSKGEEEGWAPCSYLESLQGGNEEEDHMISSLGGSPWKQKFP